MTTADLDALLAETRARLAACVTAPPAYWAECAAGIARNITAPGADPVTRTGLLALAVAALAGALASERVTVQP